MGATMFKRISYAAALLGTTVLAGGAMANPIQTVFVIAMENENFIQPNNKFTGSNELLYDGYRFDYDWEMAEGIWTFQILHNGKVIGEKKFKVIIPMN